MRAVLPYRARLAAFALAGAVLGYVVGEMVAAAVLSPVDLPPEIRRAAALAPMLSAAVFGLRSFQHYRR